jgi:hypothetical protein
MDLQPWILGALPSLLDKVWGGASHTVRFTTLEGNQLGLKIGGSERRAAGKNGSKQAAPSSNYSVAKHITSDIIAKLTTKPKKPSANSPPRSLMSELC